MAWIGERGQCVERCHAGAIFVHFLVGVEHVKTAGYITGCRSAEMGGFTGFPLFWLRVVAESGIRTQGGRCALTRFALDVAL